jgi:hypothetical protein
VLDLYVKVQTAFAPVELPTFGIRTLQIVLNWLNLTMKSRSISAAVRRMCFFRLWLFSLDGAPARWVEFDKEFCLSLDWSLSSLPEEEAEEWLE